MANDNTNICCLQISNGRICGDIAVSRAFGDVRFKTKKNEYSP